MLFRSYRSEFQKAIADFTEGIRLDPSYAFAYFQRGFAYHALEEPDKAYVDYTQSIQLDPHYITAYLNRGIILYTRRGEFDASIKDFDQALKLGPDNINALMHRGVAYGANSDFERGFADLNRAIDWLTRYYDTENRLVRGALDQLNLLRNARLMLEPPLPVDSLREVRRLRAARETRG